MRQATEIVAADTQITEAMINVESLVVNVNYICRLIIVMQHFVERYVGLEVVVGMLLTANERA